MYQYSFSNTDLILEVPNAAGVYRVLNVRGFATGENLFNIVRRAPVATTQFGAYGDMVVSMQRIRAGDLSFTVLMNAPECKVLQDYVNYFQSMADADGALIHPIQGRAVDNMGNDQVELTNGVILGIPAMSRGQNMNTLTWVITFEKTDFERGDGLDGESIGR